MSKRWAAWGLNGLAGYLLLLHGVFLKAVPDPVIHPDSISYLQPALSLMYSHRWEMAPERTPGYPLFLYFVLQLSSSFQAVLWIQHGLALLTAVITGLMALRFLNLPTPWAIACGFLCGVLPLSLLASHAILTETLYTTVGLLSLGYALRGLQTGRLRDWLAGAVCAGASVWVRPAGWAVCATFIAALIMHGIFGNVDPGFRRGDGKKMRLWGNCGGGLLAVLLPIYVWNYAHYGVARLTSFSGILLFGVAAQLLDADHVADSTIRQELIPFYSTHEQKERLNDVAWVRYGSDGPVTALRKLFPAPFALDVQLQTLAYQAVKDHPLAFAENQTAMLVDFVWNRSRVPDILLSREYTFFIVRGLWMFQKQFLNYPVSLSFFKNPPEKTRAYLSALIRVQQTSDEQAILALAEAHRLDPYRYQRVLTLLMPFAFLFPLLGGLPLVAMVCSVVLLMKDPPRRPAVGLLLTYLAAHMLLAGLGADADPRHSVPLQPVYLLLLCSGLFLVGRKARI